MAGAKEELERARSAKQKAKDLLREVPQLRGVGITRHRGVYAVKVNLEGPSDEPEADVPSEIDGVPVTVSYVGDVRSR